MTLKIYNSKDLLSPERLKLKILGYAPSGYGKSTFGETAPSPIFGCCDTGHGGGMLTIASMGLPFTPIKTYQELEEFCSGNGLEKYETLVLDAFDFAGDTFVKDYALTVPRSRGGESKKRAMGVPELDDYGTIAELERRVLAKLLNLDKHIYVNCALDYYQPAEESKPERIGGPSLPGQMRLGSAAMFDIVIRMFVRPALRNPKDANSRYNQRVWQTEADGKYIAKSRLTNGKINVFPNEVIFDKDTGTGTFKWFLEEAKKAFNSPQAAGGNL